MKPAVGLSIICCLLASTSLADEKPLQGSPTAKDSPAKDEPIIFNLVIENDSIGGRGTDKNYTSGVRIGALHPDFEIPEFIKDLNDTFLPSKIEGDIAVSYSIGNNLYTPEDITQVAQDPDDRPWAGHTYVSLGVTHNKKNSNYMDELEVSFGVVGPYSLGEQFQKFVHTHVTPDSPTPKGWRNQLKTEPTLSVAWQRRHFLFESSDFMGLTVGASPYYGATLGNAHTHGTAGMNFFIGPSDNGLQDTPLRVKPGIAGTGYFEKPDNGLNWYLFAGVEGRAVARNIFLDGNTFADSHSVDKKNLVADANAGIAFTIGNTRISYTLVYRTEEFQGQSEPSVFGALSVGVRF
ncbi:lipid A deacylase LpxR family protein [Sneathiella limimaris]|uniref:lipid A deacylase LpxR family protein n=1 Tax=Sneathiella limimaris TaxID=1964213 RepID=UPI00146E2D36|nr:lipid A deacylase LpxR family protein [Sneathiella limimaris]